MVFFSSALPRPLSAAEPLIPPVWRSGSAHRPARAPAGPGPGPGPAGGRAGFLPIHGRLGGCGTGRGFALGRVRSPGRAGPWAGSHFGGFDDRPGGAAAGFPDFGTPGSAHTVLTHTDHPVAVSACFSVSVALSFLRGLLGAASGGRAASTPSRGSLGALWRHAALAAPGSGPFSLLRAVRWPGPGPGRRLHRRPEPLGVIELTRPVAPVPPSLSAQTRT